MQEPSTGLVEQSMRFVIIQLVPTAEGIGDGQLDARVAVFGLVEQVIGPIPGHDVTIDTGRGCYFQPGGSKVAPEPLRKR